ncbi:hypothetical protein FPV67DRAFT_1557598 [Lyophyllum atratum]|nr:hypothetical protein FPV67DRAFT_1557598 [Lyophyllum atratum]
MARNFSCAVTDNIKDWEWAVLTGDIWKAHGAAVARARPYIPGSYDQPPRNIAEKISSGYKAKEWQGFLWSRPRSPLQSSSQALVHGIRIIHQCSISRSQLQEAHWYLQEFHEEFEVLYCQRRTDRIHMMRPCVHALLHLTLTVWLGPIPLYSAWTMEHVIGDLGGEIQQPYQNLSEHGASFPALDREHQESLPQGSLDIGDGYVLLRAKDKYARSIHGDEGRVIKEYLVVEEAKLGNHPPANWSGPRVARWARLRLSTGQVARSAWKENSKSLENLRRAQCVKIGETERTLALVSFYGPRDESLFKESFFTIWSMAKLGIDGLKVIEAKSIVAVVSLQPHDSNTRYFVWEQMGLDMALLADTLPAMEDENEEG